MSVFAMAMPTRVNVSDKFINAIISIVATLFILFGTGAWNLKENVLEHRDDIRSLHSDIDTVHATVERILDILCTANKNRVCTGK